MHVSSNEKLSAVLKVAVFRTGQHNLHKKPRNVTKSRFDVHTIRLSIQDLAVMYCNVRRTQFSIQVVQSICYIMK